MSMKLSNQGLSSRDEFIKFIKSIGFEYNKINGYYEYKEFRIFFKGDIYYNISIFKSGGGILHIPLNDITLLEKEFKREIRSIKLKGLLK